MAEKARYPQIPSTVWWGVHAILNKTPNATLDERFLAIQLNVQPVAAKQYITELISVGILTEEFRATPLAMKWRLDASYHEAMKELVAKVYPKGLMDLAPPGEGNRAKAISWFLQEGFGQGTAGNKAATYLLLSSKVANEAPNRSANGRVSGDETKQSKASKTRMQTDKKTKALRAARDSNTPLRDGGNSGGGVENIPLNINVQIHISADAGTEQIESIFSAMRRYLYDKQNN
jgi:hypothetical protein